MSHRWKKFLRLYRQEIWQTAYLKDASARGRVYAFLRVISITWTVFTETKAASRAAALSFSSLLGLGPLIALTVLVAGFALDNKDPQLAANTLSRLIYFVAPQVGQYGKLPSSAHRPHRPADDDAESPAAASPAAPASASAVTGSAPAPAKSPHLPSAPPNARGAPVPHQGKPAPPVASPAEMQLNPRLVHMVDTFISQGRSGSAGTVGFFSLVLIVLVLFKTVEDTFNEIWGVRSGRSLLMRVVYYWTILTLGAILFFASITLLSASAFLGVFHQTISHLPFSDQVARILQWSVPMLSFALLVMMLTLFYRIIPNTRVFWRAAFVGAMAVALLLTLNNYLAFLYVRRVILTESLYGSLGFPLLVMFGLYIFWMYVLIGGQVSYAVQNVRFRNSQAAWAQLSESMREDLMLVVLLRIGRRFQDCKPPATSSQLGDQLNVPTQILNECLNRLVDLKLITPLPPQPGSPDADLLYQPARPLSRITLFEFKERDENLGDDPIGNSLERIDPILHDYKVNLARLGEQEFFKKNLEQLFADYPFEAPASSAAGPSNSS
jgi:membrane protein